MSDLTKHDLMFHKLLKFLALIPAVQTNDTPRGGFGSGKSNVGWWVKFSLHLDHRLVWNVVQEIGYVLKELSLTERLRPRSSPYLRYRI